MSRKDSLARVLQSGIVAVIRAPSGDSLGDVAEALLAGGIDCMEVTFTVPAAIDVLRDVHQRIGDRVLLGAGTVLDTETARAAILAGAEFIVSPSTNLDVIRLCNRYDKLVMPYPVFIGDTMRAETEVTELRDSRSRPDAGIVTFTHVLVNQRDQIVCQCLRTALLKRKPG